MFNKDKKPVTTTTPTPAPAPLAPLDRAKLALKAHAVPSIISADMTIKGDLTSAGDLQVEGSVIGDIHVGKLTITATGRVTGDLHHELLTIETGGQLEGLSRRLVHEPEVATHEPVLELTSEHEVSGDRG
jgi:cytoskeletal protein CcmA (bactofilin family)